MLKNYFYIRKLKKEVKAGNKEAYYDLGIEYINGTKVKKDEEKGLTLINKASELGCSRAQHYEHRVDALEGKKM